MIMLTGFAIPIVPYLALYGYMMQIMRRIIVEGGEPFLPEWDDWGKLVTDGLKLFGAIFIYALPMFFMLAIGVGFIFVLIFATGVFVGTVDSGDGDANTPLSLIPLTSALVMVIMFGVAALFGLALRVVRPVIMGHVVATDDFGAAFRWREWWPIFRANLGGFLMAEVVVLTLSFGLGSVLSLLYYTIIFCCLVPIALAPITIYTSIIDSVIYAQTYREGIQKLKNQRA